MDGALMQFRYIPCEKTGGYIISIESLHAYLANRHSPVLNICFEVCYLSTTFCDNLGVHLSSI
jgi:hypothetical protein